MSSPTTSLVKLSAVQVDAAGRAMLAAITTLRAEARERSIANLQAEWCWRFTTAFPFVRHLNRQEAERIANGEAAGDALYDLDHRAWRYYYSDEEDLAHQFIATSRIALGGVMYLNLSDAETVSRYTRAASASAQSTTP